MEDKIVRLSYKIKDLCKEFVALPSYRPELSAVESYIADSLTYGEDGITGSSGQIRVETEISSINMLSATFEKIRLTPEYEAVVDQIQNDFTEEKKCTLDQFIPKIIHHIAQNKTLTKKQIQRYASRYISDLRSEFVLYRVRIGLVGLTLESQAPIRLSAGVALRRPTVDDLSIKRMIGSPSFGHTNDPTAILEFKVEDKPNSGVVAQKKAQRILTILRLFCVGSIQRTTLTATSKSLLYPSTGVVFSGNIKSPDRYYLRMTEENSLRKFIKNLQAKLPDVVINETLDDEIGISYDRYKQALTEKNPLELRISNIIMGLEALYCTKDENTEVNYRLKNRVAKLSQHLGYEPLTTRDLIALAYDVRSRYSHGEKTNQSKLARFKELSEALGSEHALMNILRMSIVLFCELNADNKPEDPPVKQNVIQLCDESFISNDKAAVLGSMIKSRTH